MQYFLEENSKSVPPKSEIKTTLKTRAMQHSLCVAGTKMAFPLLGEIYETEDTKPRLLIKIIHFGQSGPGEKFAAAAAATDSLFFFFTSPRFLFFFIYLTSTPSTYSEQWHTSAAPGQSVTSTVTHVF